MKNDTIVISIHPCYVEQIWSGKKTFEYRKHIPKDIKYMLIYSTSPIKKITTIVEVDTVLEDTVETIWEQTKNNSGISKHDYFKYYNGCEKAKAIKLKKVHKLDNFLFLNELEGIKSAPQSYVYLKQSIDNILDKIDIAV